MSKKHLLRLSDKVVERLERCNLYDVVNVPPDVVRDVLAIQVLMGRHFLRTAPTNIKTLDLVFELQEELVTVIDEAAA